MTSSIVMITKAETSATDTAVAGAARLRPVPDGSALLTTSSTPSPAPAPPPAPAPDLAGAVAGADGIAGGDIDLGVAVLDFNTGQVTSGHQGSKPFYTASLSKLLLAVDMLTRRATGDLQISDSDLELVDRALTASDDDVMDSLWTTYDGTSAIERVASAAGMTETTPPRDPSQWGEVVVSAADMTRLFYFITHKMAAGDRDVIIGDLSATQRRATDGFDQFFGLLDGSHGVYAKQGWMYYLPSDLYLHSCGVVNNRFAVAVLSIQTGVATQTARNRLGEVSSSLLRVLLSA
jgi:hypothetical protein